MGRVVEGADLIDGGRCGGLFESSHWACARGCLPFLRRPSRKHRVSCRATAAMASLWLNLMGLTGRIFSSLFRKGLMMPVKQEARKGGGPPARCRGRGGGARS